MSNREESIRFYTGWAYKRYKQHVQSKDFKWLRAEVFSRDHWQCTECGKIGSDGVRLHVHHIKYPEKPELDCADNMVTLCTRCHTNIHNVKLGGESKIVSLRNRLSLIYEAHQRFLTTNA